MNKEELMLALQSEGQVTQLTESVEANNALDNIFEAANLSEDVKSSFKAVFAKAVKTQVEQLQESMAEVVVAKNNELVEKAITDGLYEQEIELAERVDAFANSLQERWLEENAEAVEYDVKVDLFESFMGSLKQTFIDNNVSIPEDKVDVVAELNEELLEHKQNIAQLTESSMSKDAELNKLNKRLHLVESCRELTETQTEQVMSLVEDVDYDHDFGGLVDTFVKLVSRDTTATNSSVQSLTEEDITALNYSAIAGLTESQILELENESALYDSAQTQTSYKRKQYVSI